MISIRNLTMTYRSAATEHQAVKGISLEVGQGQFYTLLGPSGCGKTTTLRCVAGLETPDSGEIIVGDVGVFSSERGVSVPPNNRNIGMVFQSYAIWPHMSVFENVAFPLRHLTPKPGRAEIRKKVLETLDLVQLGGLEDRPAPFLSGGQQQRLALARALVPEPRVLLLDEPLSNLDAKLREEMRFELRELVKRLSVTTLFVTHEQLEALTMSDTIAVMNDGVIVQEGTPAEIYTSPKEQFVADFIGKTNFLDGKVLSSADGEKNIGQVDTAIGRLSCRMAAEDAVPGDRLTLAVRPENVVITRGDGLSGDNILAGHVDSVVYLGNILDCEVKVADQLIRAQVHPSEVMTVGEKVMLRFPPECVLAMRQ